VIKRIPISSNHLTSSFDWGTNPPAHFPFLLTISTPRWMALITFGFFTSPGQPIAWERSNAPK